MTGQRQRAQSTEQEVKGQVTYEGGTSSDETACPTTAATPPDLYRMTPEEVAFGWLFGTSDSHPPARGGGSPLDTLEAVVRKALRRQPCVVMFSGGRDSSAVLAAAVRLARREGYPEPVALTYVYRPGSMADETEWQERVIRHVGVQEWERLPVSEEMDLVGPVAAPALLEHGPAFPPAAFAERYGFRHASGGSVLTGDLGDDVFGAHRAGALRRLRGRGGFRLRRWGPAARAVAPRYLRHRWALGHARAQTHAWLRSDVDDQRARLLATDMAAAPFDWRSAIWHTVQRRAIVLGLPTVDRMAADFDVAIHRPLMDLDFVASFGTAGGRLGYASRRDGMTSVFGGMLPADVLARTSKAVFNESRFGPHTRSFAERWDGTGVDLALVDPERLRQEWLADEPHAGSAALLQQAWLATRAPRPTSGRA